MSQSQAAKDHMDSYDESIELEQRLALAEEHLRVLQKDLEWARGTIELRNAQIKRILRKKIA